MVDDESAVDPDAVDIKALLSVALETKPPDDFSDRVMARVAAVTTAMEFVRLVGAAPLAWLVEPAEPEDELEDPEKPAEKPAEEEAEVNREP